ncbi:MAG TPA: 4-hydroxy-tetrahydrodipicolinate reductase [Bacillota bacterium]
MNQRVRVAVTGACGKMGAETARAVLDQSDMQLVAAVDRERVGEDFGPVIGRPGLGLAIVPSLPDLLAATKVDVVIDFTRAEAARGHIDAAIAHGVRPVVGTTGLTLGELDKIDFRCRRLGLGAVICPNFSVGAMLLGRFAREAAAYFAGAEIIELHHQTKVDAPSGTALRLRAAIDGPPPGAAKAEPLSTTPIHSVRLPGLVAHHEIIFGGPGETLTLRHDSLSRQGFMPGLMKAVRVVRGLTGLVTDLETILRMEAPS